MSSNFCTDVLASVPEKRHSHVHLYSPLKPLGPSSGHSHHHSKKDKSKKREKKKYEDTTKKKPPPEITQGIPAEEEQTKDVSTATEGSDDVVDEKLETNVDIVDQTINVLPEITEHEILVTPASTPPVRNLLADGQESAVVVDVKKETKTGHHRYKHIERPENKDTPTCSKGGRHHRHHHHRHRHKSELQERRRPGAATLNEKNQVQLDTRASEVSSSAVMDLKDEEDMTCE